MTHNGDAYIIQLNYTVNDIPLAQFAPDEIEFMFGRNRYLLSDGSIRLNSESGLYEIFITQLESFDLEEWTEYQIRVMKDGFVSANCVSNIQICEALSREVLNG